MSNCSFTQNRQHSNTSSPSFCKSNQSRPDWSPIEGRMPEDREEDILRSGIFVEWGGVGTVASSPYVMCSLRLSWRSTRTRIRMSEEETRTTRHGLGSSLFAILSRSVSVLTLSHHLSEWLLSQESWNPAWKKEMNISNFSLYILSGLSFYSVWNLTSPQ